MTGEMRISGSKHLLKRKYIYVCVGGNNYTKITLQFESHCPLGSSVWQGVFQLSAPKVDDNQRKPVWHQP